MLMTMRTIHHPRQFSPFQPMPEETIALFQEKGRMTIAMVDGMKPSTIGRGKYITIRSERIYSKPFFILQQLSSLLLSLVHIAS